MPLSVKRKIGAKRRVRKALGIKSVGFGIPNAPSVSSIIRQIFSQRYYEKEPNKYPVIKTDDPQFKKKIMYQVFGRTSKAFLKQFADTVYLSIPTTGSGYTFKRTKVTTGRAVTPLGRLATKQARVKLKGRRVGNALADQARAIKTAHAKIDRMTTERMEYLSKAGRPIMTVSLGSYYRNFIHPLYDSARRNLSDIIQERIKRLR